MAVLYITLPDVLVSVNSEPSTSHVYDPSTPIEIAYSCPTLAAQYAAASDAERITLFQSLSAQDQIDVYNGLTDAERLALFNGLSNANKEDLLFYTYDYSKLYTGQVTSYQTGDTKHQWDNIYTPEINSWPSNRQWIFPILDPTNFNLLKRGATASGNNIFGNLQRFTDDLGTQIYSNGVLIDHYLGLMVDITFKATSNWTTSISNSISSTVFSKNDWRVGNSYFWEIFTKRAQNGGYLDGLPPITFLNVPLNTSDRFIWSSNSSDGDLINLGDIYILRQTAITSRRNGVASFSKTSTIPNSIYIRKCFTYNALTGLMELT